MNPSEATNIVERFFALMERSPSAFVAAFFALYAAAVSVAFVLFVTKRNKEELQRIQGLTGVMGGLHTLLDTLNPLVYELQRKGMRRGGTNPGMKLSDVKAGSE